MMDHCLGLPTNGKVSCNTKMAGAATKAVIPTYIARLLMWSVRVLSTSTSVPFTGKVRVLIELIMTY